MPKVPERQLSYGEIMDLQRRQDKTDLLSTRRKPAKPKKVFELRGMHWDVKKPQAATDGK